jgi:DNA-binding transcriptional ArsR family regulator
MRTEEKALESGPLERLLGGSAVARILDFMVVFRRWDYSKMDIAKNSGVSFRHALREIPKLEKLGIIKETRRVGRAVMYQLDEDSPIGKTMKDLIFQMGRLEAEEAAREELAKEETAKEKAIEVAVAPTA